MTPGMRSADQLKMGVLVAILGACLYSFVYTMFLTAPSQGVQLKPNISRYCRSHQSAWQTCNKKQEEDCNQLKRAAEVCAQEVQKAYQIVNIKCGTYIDAWARCGQENAKAAANERPCATQNGAMVACADAVVKPQLESAGFNNAS